MNQNNTISLDIDGMTCTACAARIERVLNNNTQVNEASVSFPLKQAEIESDGSLNVEDLIEDIYKAGYSAKVHEEKELQDNKYKEFFTPFLSLILTIVVSSLLSRGYESQANLIGIFIIIFFGKRFHISSFRSMKRLDFNMDSLISIGSLSSIIVSLIPLVGNKSFVDTGGYIISFLLIGKTVEEISIQKSISIADAIKKSIPKRIRVIKDNQERFEDTGLVSIGESVKILPGEIVPIDGEITEGDTLVDESIVTGESNPIKKKPGDQVVSGSINLSNPIVTIINKIDSESTFNQIAEMVKKAQFSKPLIQNLIDKITSVFVPGIILLAFITFLARFYVLDEDIVRALSVAISVLVIACPCALGLATPLVLYKSAILANSNGIIFKGYDILERLNGIDALVFDKTGTLTTGIFRIKEISHSSHYTSAQILSFVASVEQYSNHPIARSILLEAEEAGVEVNEAMNVVETPGTGIEGSVSGKQIKILKSLNLEGIETKLKILIDREEVQIELEEELNAESYIVEDLSSRFKLSILSGDNDIKTGEFAKLLDIDDAIGDLSPEGKLKKITDLQKSFNIAYIGDGINDAPSLKQADVGIATSSSTQFARSAGDIILIKGDLNKINTIFTISENSFKRIKQNLFLALIYNISMIPIAVTGNIKPMYAALAMALSSISVVLNSTRVIKT